MTFIQLGNPKNSKEEEKEALISEKKKYDESFRKIIDFFSSSSFNPVVHYMYMYVHS